MDDEPILLSWISQWVFCKRRFYLQIAEQNFIENVFTAEGARDHKRHDGELAKRCCTCRLRMEDLVDGGC